MKLWRLMGYEWKPAWMYRIDMFWLKYCRLIALMRWYVTNYGDWRMGLTHWRRQL